MLEAQTATQGDSVGDWLVGHAIDGVDQNISTYTCQVKVESYVDRAVSVRTGDNLKFVVSLTSAETAAMPVGQHIISVIVANAGSGYHQQVNGILTIQDSTPEPATELDRLTALKEALQDAALTAVGGSVVEVWNGRYGNKMKYQPMKYAEIRAELVEVDRLIAAEQAVAAGGSRRGAAGLFWKH